MAETDYQYGGEHDAFSAAMERRDLNGAAPKVVPELSGRRYWSRRWTARGSTSTRATCRGCAAWRSAYSRCSCFRRAPRDPHPGNLLRSGGQARDIGRATACPRTSGTRAATFIPPPTSPPPHLLTPYTFLIQYSPVEFIAHVNSEDYDATHDVNLGFTPESQLERVRQVSHATPASTPHPSHPTPHAYNSP